MLDLFTWEKVTYKVNNFILCYVFEVLCNSEHLLLYVQFIASELGDGLTLCFCSNITSWHFRSPP